MHIHVYTCAHIHIWTHTCMPAHTCTHTQAPLPPLPAPGLSPAWGCFGLSWTICSALVSSRARWCLRHGLCSLAVGRPGLHRASPAGALSPSSALQAAGWVTRAWTPSQQGHWRAAHLLQLTGHTLPLGSWVPAKCHLRSPNHCLAVVSFLPKHDCGKLQGSHGVDYVAIPTEGQIDSSQLSPVSTHNTVINTTPVVVPEDEVAELQQGQGQSKAPEWE